MSINRPGSTSARSGLTLGEVLISLLIMSIGVSTLMLLFPIATLRALQGTNLTHATVLSYDAEAQAKFQTAVGRGADTWGPGLSLVRRSSPAPVGTLVVPSLDTGFLMGRSPGWVFEYVGSINASAAIPEPDWPSEQRQSGDGQTPLVLDASSNPQFSAGGLVFPNSVNSYSFPPSPSWRARRQRFFVVDPLGFLRQDANGDDGRCLFGNNGLVGGANAFDCRTRLRAASDSAQSLLQEPRLRRCGLPGYDYTGLGGGISAADQSKLAQMAILPDSWVEQGRGSSLGAVSFASGEYQLTVADLTVDLTTFATGGKLRVVFFDSSGRSSQIRDVTSVGSATTLRWKNPLPTSFAPASLRVDLNEQRYSFLLSFRCNLASSTFDPVTDVVVFFRRRFSLLDEQLFPAVFRKGWDAGPDGVFSNPPGYVLSDDREIDYAVIGYSSDGPVPDVKSNSYVCDYVNMRWYKVKAVSAPFGATDLASSDAASEFAAVYPASAARANILPNKAQWTDTQFTQTGTINRWLKVTLTEPVAASNDPSGTDQPNDADHEIPLRGVMCPKNVVDVFPIEAPNGR